jgi:hypothetical protein
MNPQQDYTKPSRVKRHLKRRWKKPKQIQDCKRALTASFLRLILSPLSQKTKAGICSPDNIGHNRPSFTMVFLCPHQTPTALRRLFSVMAGCIGQPLKRLAGSNAGTANLIQSATQCFAALIGGYSSYIGVTA